MKKKSLLIHQYNIQYNKMHRLNKDEDKNQKSQHLMNQCMICHFNGCYLKSLALALTETGKVYHSNQEHGSVV